MTNLQRAYLSGLSWAQKAYAGQGGYVGPHFTSATGGIVKACDMTDREKQEYHRGVREYEPE